MTPTLSSDKILSDEHKACVLGLLHLHPQQTEPLQDNPFSLRDLLWTYNRSLHRSFCSFLAVIEMRSIYQSWSRWHLTFSKVQKFCYACNINWNVILQTHQEVGLSKTIIHSTNTDLSFSTWWLLGRCTNRKPGMAENCIDLIHNLANQQDNRVLVFYSNHICY